MTGAVVDTQASIARRLLDPFNAQLRCTETIPRHFRAQPYSATQRPTAAAAASAAAAAAPAAAAAVPSSQSAAAAASSSAASFSASSAASFSAASAAAHNQPQQTAQQRGAGGGTPLQAAPYHASGAPLPPGWTKVMDFGKVKGYRGPRGERAGTKQEAWRRHDAAAWAAEEAAAAEAAAAEAAAEPCEAQSAQ